MVHVPKVSPVCDFGVHNLGARRINGLQWIPWVCHVPRELPENQSISECKTGKSTNSLSKYFTSPPLSARYLKDFEHLNHSWHEIHDSWRSESTRFTAASETFGLKGGVTLRCWIANQSMPVKKGCPFTLDATKCWLRVRKLGKRTHHTVSYLIKNVEACGGMWRHIEYK